MKLSTRYGLVGICSLALLTLVHWVRAQPKDWPAEFGYMLGVLPNALAAIAIPFVLMGIVADQKQALTRSKIRFSFYASVALSCAGLIVWEFIQRSSDRLIFDTDDLLATLFGSLFSIAVFMLITARQQEN